MAQRHTALEQEQETSSKVAASALAQNYLADLVPAVFSNLRQKGFFFNGVERDIESSFMPWLRDAVQEELDKVLTGKDVLDGEPAAAQLHDGGRPMFKLPVPIFWDDLCVK